MKLFALISAGHRCRVEEAALAMLAGPKRIAGPDT
jgi:hypothetical protein